MVFLNLVETSSISSSLSLIAAPPKTTSFYPFNRAGKHGVFVPYLALLRRKDSIVSTTKKTKQMVYESRYDLIIFLTIIFLLGLEKPFEKKPMIPSI